MGIIPTRISELLVSNARVSALAFVFLGVTTAGGRADNIWAPAPSVPLMLAAVDGESAAGTAIGEGAPWDPVIRDVQQALAELGLFKGPVDGRYSAVLKGAIERFERRYGVIGDGEPLPKALRSMSSVNAALQLRRSLDDTRRRQIRDAVHALRMNPETRDLLRAPDRAGETGVTCGVTPTVTCLLAEAAATVSKIERAHSRDWALRELIVAETRTGRMDSVRNRLRRLSDPRLVLVALREVADALATDGRAVEALELAETIPDTANRARALASIAAALGASGRKVEGRRLAGRVLEMLEADTSMPGRVAVATGMASGFAEAGDGIGANLAIAAARRFASPSSAAMVRRAEMGMITGAVAETGRRAAQSGQLAELADVYTRQSPAAGGSPVARAAAAENGRYRVTTLSNIGIVQARLGDEAAGRRTLKKAEKAARGVRKGYPAAIALFTVARAWARVGDFRRADALVEKLDKAALRARGYWEVGTARLLADDRTGAAKADRRAMRATAQIASVFDRTILFSDGAVARARRGMRDQAMAIFEAAWRNGRDITVDWWRARAFARLAVALHAIETGGAAQ